jgi:hypothetical protein
MNEFEILLDALLFYANRESWMFSYNIHSGKNYREIHNGDTYGIKPDSYYGGKKAREAIKKMEELGYGEAIQEMQRRRNQVSHQELERLGTGITGSGILS